jgi:molybdopterin-guanine dinucleotide biosynthesis protein A
VNIIASVIARQNSKRLVHKNLLPYKGKPLVLRAVQKLLHSNLFDQVILSTDSELIAYTCMNESGLSILRRPPNLCGDNVASIPVFQHILESFPADVHLNYNCNFPECDQSVFERGIELALKNGESLSDPYAVWSQTGDCLMNYGDPFQITAETFKDDGIGVTDVHTMGDLIHIHREALGPAPWRKSKKN